MLLSPEKSICERNQKIIVSRDRGSRVEHRATNQDGVFDVRHYRLDGELIHQEKCCDYLLINDTSKKAYFIELKGGNVDEAVVQLEAAAEKCKGELKGYSFWYRIVCSKAKTHKIKSNKYRKFMEKCGKRLKCQEGTMNEVLN